MGRGSWWRGLLATLGGTMLVMPMPTRGRGAAATRLLADARGAAKAMRPLGPALPAARRGVCSAPQACAQEGGGAVPLRTAAVGGRRGTVVRVDFRQPAAEGAFGAVFYGDCSDGTACVVKLPRSDAFSRRVFETERAVSRKLRRHSASTAAAHSSVPWATLIGELEVPAALPVGADLARCGMAWRKEGTGDTLERLLCRERISGLYRAFRCQEAGSHGLRAELCHHVLVELLRALSLMHAHGIAHRDVKPENTLVVPEDAWHKLKVP